MSELTNNDLKSYIKSYYEDRKITYTRLDKHDRAIGVLINENERLNNIINELEKYLDDKIINTKVYINNHFDNSDIRIIQTERIFVFQTIKKKLIELKGEINEKN